MSETVAVRRSTATSRAAAVVFAALVVLLALAPMLFVDSVLLSLVQFFYLLALAQSWNLLAGYAGLVSIGQQAYVGAGAYALLTFTNILGWNPFVGVALAAVVAAILALITSVFVFRLQGGYFAIGTWVLAEVYRLIVAQHPAARRWVRRHLAGRRDRSGTPDLRHVLDRAGGRCRFRRPGGRVAADPARLGSAGDPGS